MEVNTYRIIALGILATVILGLGAEGCAVNNTYQFRIGGYCNRLNARDSSEWVRCDILKGDR